MLISIVDFKGMLPRIIPRLLPNNFAQVARNCRLEDGAIAPMRYSLDTTVHTFGDAARSFVIHNNQWFSWPTVVNAVAGPVATDRLYTTGEAKPKMWSAGTWYDLAVPTPSSIPTINVSGVVNPAISEAILYCYTYVTENDEESLPSPPSAATLWSYPIINTVGNIVTSPAATARGVNRIRIYRSQTSDLGVTDFYFVAEVAAGTTAYAHNIVTAPLAEPITSLDNDLPPDSLRGLISLPNGMMAAFAGKKLFFCEPFIPHAWPSKYSLTVDYPIVALVSFGSTIAVLTTGTPYVVQGTHPDSLVMERIEQNLPCLAAQGVADLGYTAIYPSTEGLVSISPSGAQVISKALFTLEQWEAFTPASFISGVHDGRYVFSFFDIENIDRQVGIIDMTGQNPFYVEGNGAVAAMFYSIGTGDLYLLRGIEAGTKVVRWERGDHVTFRWKSKRFELPSKVSFGAIIVDADPVAGAAETFACDVLADGVVIRTITNTNQIERLPDTAETKRWEIEVRGRVAVTAIRMGITPDDLSVG